MKRRALFKGVAASVVAALGINRDLSARVLLDTKCQHPDLVPDPLADYHLCLSCGEKVSGIDLLQAQDRANLADVIYDISPAETPFCRRAKR